MGICQMGHKDDMCQDRCHQEVTALEKGQHCACDPALSPWQRPCAGNSTLARGRQCPGLEAGFGCWQPCVWQRRTSSSLSWSSGEEPGTSLQLAQGPTCPEVSVPPPTASQGCCWPPAPNSIWILLLLTTLPMGQSDGNGRDRQPKHGRVLGRAPGQHLMAQHGCGH